MSLTERELREHYRQRRIEKARTPGPSLRSLIATTETPLLKGARMFGSFYAWKAREICRDEIGLTSDEIQRAAELADIKRDVREFLCGIYGNPMYGSWPERAFETQREEYERRGAKELL